jgi:hypothetical protein
MVLIAASLGSERYHIRAEQEEALRKANFYEDSYFKKSEELLACEWAREYCEGKGKAAK